MRGLCGILFVNERRLKVKTENNGLGLAERLVRRIIFILTPVYHPKYKERHKAIYGMTPLEKVADQLEKKAQKQKDKANQRSKIVSFRQIYLFFINLLTNKMDHSGAANLGWKSVFPNKECSDHAKTETKAIDDDFNMSANKFHTADTHNAQHQRRRAAPYAACCCWAARSGAES